MTKWQSGLLFALLGTFLFSSKGIFIKLAYAYPIDTITLIALRMAFALPFYFILLFWSIHKMKPEQKQLSLDPARLAKISVLGVMGYYIASFLDLEALHYISVQLERLVLLTYPIFVALLSWLLFGEKLSGNVFLALILGYSGVAVLFGHDYTAQETGLWGGGLVVMAAFSFAFYFTLAKSQITLSGSVFFTCVAMIAASVVVFFHFFIVHDWQDLFVRYEVVVWAMVIAFFCTVLPSFMMSEAIARIGSVSSAMIGSSGPFFTAVMAIFILGEPFTAFHVLGMGLTMTGVYILGKKS